MKYINSFENFALFESMDPDKLSKLNIFLIKMDIDTRRITSTKFFDFYRNVIVTKFLNKFEKEVPHISQLLMMLRSSANNQNESRIVEYLKKIQTAFLIDDTGKTPWISEGNIKLHLNRSDSRKIGNIHEELLSLLRTWEILSTPDGIDSDVIDSKDSIRNSEIKDKVSDFVMNSGGRLLPDENLKISDILHQIKIEPEHQKILDLMPDYKGLEVSLTTYNGSRFVPPASYQKWFKNWQQKEKERGKSNKTEIKFDGLPSSEVFAHELLHYFTIPILSKFWVEGKEEASLTDVQYKYCKDMMELYTNYMKYQLKGLIDYTIVNGVSLDINIYEFAVCITNKETAKNLKASNIVLPNGKKTNMYDCHLEITSDYLRTL